MSTGIGYEFLTNMLKLVDMREAHINDPMHKRI